MAGFLLGQVIAKISPEIENLTPCLSSVVLASTHKEVSHMNDAIRKHLNRPVSHLVPEIISFVRNMFINENLVPQGTYFVVTASDASTESWGGADFGMFKSPLTWLGNPKTSRSNSISITSSQKDQA